MKRKRVLIGVTGASGALYARRLLQVLARSRNLEVLAVASDAGRRVVREELGAEWPCEPCSGEAGGGEGKTAGGGSGSDFVRWLDLEPEEAHRLRFLPADDIGAPPASGSYALDAMAVVPCSMRTLGAVAGGLADNLLTRAADVCIKENRPLVLVPRECPFSAIHLENMLRLARLGVRIVPPAPPFYQKPKTIEDLVNFIVGKILGQMGIEDDSEKMGGSSS